MKVKTGMKTGMKWKNARLVKSWLLPMLRNAPIAARNLKKMKMKSPFDGDAPEAP